jgi:tetratricopeptide (TPR) repeat protein
MGLSQLILITALLGVSPGSTPAGLPESPPRAEAIMAIPPALRDRLETDVIALGSSADSRLDLLARFIFSSEGLGLRYSNTRTTTVSETYAAGHGNCLSFTLLFLALAEAAGIEADPREVYVPASWLQDGQTLFETGHINVLVETELRRAVVDFEPNPILSRRLSRARRGEVISLDRALAHFYNNRAAEILAGDGPSPAFEALAWSEAALELAPDFTPALNNRGVIEQRLGHWEAARSYFEAALAEDPRSASTLFNLLQLSLERDRIEEAERIIARLEDLPSDDPYFSWSMGRNYESLGQIALARQHYRQALIDHPDNERFALDFARINGNATDRALSGAPLDFQGIKRESFIKSLH